MLATITTSGQQHQNDQNKENFNRSASSSLSSSSNSSIFEMVSARVSSNEIITDDDAESSHSDCMIVEDDKPSESDVHIDVSVIGRLPNSLPKQTPLLLVYEDQSMDVRLVTSITDLEQQQRITISHLNYLYSIPKRHLFLSISSDFQHTLIPRQSRIIQITNTLPKMTLFGFIGETPTLHNRSRHLILYDDGTAAYLMPNDRIHLCLCQDFEQINRSIESELVRQYLQMHFSSSCDEKIHHRFHPGAFVRVKKFGNKYHNAQVIDIDCSIMKLKFYERQAQTEMWIHQYSSLIDDDETKMIILPTKRKRDEIPLIHTKQSWDTAHFFVSSPSPIPFLLHQCSAKCVRIAEQNFDPKKFHQNPFTLPFTCGWKYFHINRSATSRPWMRKSTTRKMPTSRLDYLYRSPCDRSLLTLDEIEQYLFDTHSKLSIKYFVDHRSIRLESCMTYDSKFILDEDLSGGHERVKIPVFNDNNRILPEPFLYGTENRSELIFDQDPTMTTTCCSCTDNCRDRTKCQCWLKTFQQAKQNHNEQIRKWQRQNLTDKQMLMRFGYINQRLKIPVWSGIYECNSQCLCHKEQCSNRVVQNQLYQQLQLFHTATKGWGLRVLHDIPHGSFINSYIGELITEDMATKRDYKYLATLDHKSHLRSDQGQQQQQGRARRRMNNIFDDMNEVIGSSSQIPVKRRIRQLVDSQSDSDGDDDEDESCFILDAKFYGSISRFYNHSCKPNVVIQNVFINSHDARFPVIGLFASRNIRAGEEICWDYNYTVGCMPGVRIDCQCQTSNCRGRLL